LPTLVENPQRSSLADEHLVARALSGSNDCLERLFDRYRPLVRAKTRSYFLAGADADDVFQEGLIGLYKAMRDFDPARQVSFRSFADLCVTRQIITAVKTATRHKHGPLNSYVSLHGEHDDERRTATAEDRFFADFTDPADSVVSAAELSALEAHVSRTLSALEADVLDRYVGGETYAEIADALDRHVKAIDNALQRIKRKIATYLHARDIAS
jgi:RNA polymerase sporulation-specific sigma factor